MNRVLVTGGAGTIGAAVVRRLLRDPDFEVRVSDQRQAPGWMREGCEVHTGDLRVLDEAREATRGCTHVIHLAAIVGGIANFHKLPHTLTEVNNALYNAVVRAALDHDVERFTYVSSSMVFERATQYPTTEEHIVDTPIPRSAYGFSKLTGEVYVRAAHDEHGLPYTICRPFNAYGPGEMPDDEPGIAHMVPDLIRKCLSLPRGAPLPIFGDGTQTRTLTHIDDIADGIVTATASPSGLNDDFKSDGRTPRWTAASRRAWSASVWSAYARANRHSASVELVAAADVAGDHGRAAGAGVPLGQQVAADAGVVGQRRGVDAVDGDRALHVPELAHVVLVRRRRVVQPSSGSLTVCSACWYSTTRWPWCACQAESPCTYRADHRPAGLLELQEHARRPGCCPRTARRTPAARPSRPRRPCGRCRPACSRRAMRRPVRRQRAQVVVERLGELLGLARRSAG